MELEGLKDVLVRWLAEKLLSRIDSDMVSEMLEYLVETLKTKAEETERVIDDWLVEAIEDIVRDEEKVRTITVWVREKIGQFMLQETCGKEEFIAVASEIIGGCEDGVCSVNSENLQKVAQVLEAVIGSLNAYFKE